VLFKECALIGRLQQKAFRAESLHNVQAVYGPDLVLPVVQVVLHGLFRQAEVIRDFLVGEAFGNQRNKLLLAPERKARAGLSRAVFLGLCRTRARWYPTRRHGPNPFKEAQP
jgi:hypothetical protein